MATNFALPYGPAGRIGHMATSVGFYADFTGDATLSTTADAATFHNVSTSGGTATISSAEENGAVAIASGAAGDDGGIELNGEPFVFSHSRDMVFECRCKLSAIAGAGIFVGLHTEAFDVGSGAGITGNHIGFTTQNDANIDVTAADGTTQSISDSGSDFVADTYVVLSWKWAAQAQRLTYYVDGSKVADINPTDDNLPADGTQLTLGAHCEFQTVADITLTVDYIMIAGDRD